MIRKNIIKNKNDKQRYFLNDSWRIEMPAVVRTPFYGNNCSEYFGYVVTYSEMEQAYHLLKVDLHTHVLAVVLSQPGGTPPEVSCKGAKPLAFVGGNALLVD